MRESESVIIDEQFNISTRTYYSILHLKTADLFSNKAKEIEGKYEGEFDLVLTSELNSYVTSVILSSVAFLEANINETLSDIFEGNSHFRSEIDKDKQEQLRKLWHLGIPRTASYSVLNKYETTLVLLVNKKLDKGCSPIQDILQLIKLRNALIHFEPEWKSWTESNNDKDKFFKALNGKFELNPFFSKEEPFFPQRCLGAGCAEWAVINSLKFVDEFCNLSGLKPLYGELRDKILIKNKG